MSTEHELICREFVELLLEYLAGELPPESAAAFDRHLGECPSCVAYMKTYQQAIRLAREATRSADAEDDRVPDDLAAHLVRALVATRRSS